MTSASLGTQRAPRQDRSKRSWQRVLNAGTTLVLDKGWDGLTIAEVCRRADVSAPSIYARVDGKAGLFRAIHDCLLADVRVSEDELLHELFTPGLDADRATHQLSRVIVLIFRRHGEVLRSLIERSTRDGELLRRGGDASRSFLERAAERSALPRSAAEAAARAVYAECLIRLMYGTVLLGPSGEDDEAFDLRMAQLAARLARP